jgi:hypothetical protein
MKPMKQQVPYLSAFAALLLAAPLPAQQAPAQDGTVHTRPAPEVLAQIGQSAGVIVLTDATVFARLPVPAMAATPDTVDAQLTAMVRSLPAGTTMAKLYVPAPSNGRWSAEAVGEYARALARLVGTVGREAPAGMVEILGRPVPKEKASEYAAALNLKLVYLVTNTHAATPADATANWSRLAPAQRDAYIHQQAQRIMSLDPASRIGVLRGLMMNREPTPQDELLKAVFSQMSDGERIQLKSSFAGDKPREGGGGK